jgi:transposase
MATKMDAALERNITEAYRLGESTTLIASRYGVTRETVYNVAKRNGIARNRKDAQIVVHSKRDASERKAWTKLANETRRGQKDFERRGIREVTSNT